MSLLPFLFDETFVRPSKVLDQHFGLVLNPEDLWQPLTIPRSITRCPAGYLRHWKSSASDKDSGSTISYDSDKFEAILDVQQFKPEELTVKVTGDNTVTVEGKHEEKEDEHGQIYRHFIRRYALPKNFDMDKIQTKLSSDGVLTISAPKIDVSQLEHKSIPVTQTGEPAKAVENKK